MKDSTLSKEIPPILQALMELIEAHRAAFRQERTYRRGVGLVFGELFSFARHTVTQSLLALGLTDGDWSAWYRLFSRERFDEEKLSACLLQESLEHVGVDEPYCAAIDGTSIHRSSLKMPGTSWLRDARFSAFRPGIHRAQRFLHGAWLTPLEEGYSRAIPLRFLLAFPPKAIPAGVPARREWEAGSVFIHWLRQGLDGAGRAAQQLLVLADGGFDVLDLWRELPERVTLVTRTARNRCLYYLPKPDSEPGPGRPPSYGERAPHPADWLHAGLRNWPTQSVAVRGKRIQMRYQLLGPFVREGLPERPLFLIVVKGRHRLVGKKKLRYKHRGPSFYLVSAVQTCAGDWQLPLPVASLLTWVWVKNNVGTNAPRSSLSNGAPGPTRFCSWQLIAPGGCVVDLLPRLAGGQELNAGLSPPSGALTARISGTNMNFDPFGPQPLTTGGKKKPCSLLGTMPPSQLLESKAGDTLFCASRFSFYLLL